MNPGLTRRVRSRRPGRRGFTLIEAMLALAIFAGVMAAIYSSWMAILRGTRVGLTAAAEAQRLRVAIGALEDAITGAQMVPANVRHYSFIAETDRNESVLSFVSRLPRSFPRGGRYGDLGVRRVTFSTVIDRDGSQSLLLRQTPLLLYPDGDVDEEENPLVLAKGLASVQFEYWGGRSGEWEPDWMATNQLPQLIRFTLEFNRPGTAHPDPAQVVSRVVALPASALTRLPPGSAQSGLDSSVTNAPLPGRRRGTPASGGPGALR